MKKTLFRLSALTATAFSLVACANTASPDMSQNTDVLKKYHWQLQTATDIKQQTLTAFYAGEATPKAQLDFHNESLFNIYGSCNRMGGAYQINGDNIHSGHLRSTMMACDNKRAEQDRALAGFFEQQNLHYQIDQHASHPVLTLKNQQGQVLHFQGQATAETKYNSQGETIFLKVSHQTKTCNDGNRNMQCLQVKEVRYDQQGLQTYIAPEWSLFYSPIEGYTHRPNTENILRIKRYEVQNPPADSSKYAYILDLTVMSGSVK